MRARRGKVPCGKNDGWYERYGKGGFFCLPRPILFNLKGHIDNATFYVYVALASYHFKGNTTYPGAASIATLTGKDERAIRGHLKDLEELGLITREKLGQGYKILFECPNRERVKEGASAIAERRNARATRRTLAKYSSVGVATDTEADGFESFEDFDVGEYPADDDE